MMTDPTPTHEPQQGAESPAATPHEPAGGERHPPPRQEARSARGERDFERWTRDELYAKAKELGIDGRSKMTKQELLRAVQAH